MCCLFTILVLLGARAVDIVWWLADPARWDVAFSSWIWPVLGIILLPWTTMFYVIVAPGGVNGFDWLWVVLGVAIDIAFWGGGARQSRGRAS
jgi:uncharacterized membrane protein YczE